MDLELRHLRRIERLNLVLAALLCAASLLARRVDVILGVVLGAGLSVLNFYAIRRVAEAVLRSRNQRKQFLLMSSLLGKMALLIGLVFVIIRYAPVHVIAFIVGLSTFLVSILVMSFRMGGTGEEEPREPPEKPRREHDLERAALTE